MITAANLPLRAVLGALLLSNSCLPASGQSIELLLFGGEANRNFLGCLNCGSFSPTSICNRYGSFGSKFASDSIWNKFGTYGSKYSSSSPWNRYTSSAPVIVDRDGNFYGHFTSNEYHIQRSRADWLTHFFKAAADLDDLDDVRDLLCGQ